MPSLASSLSLQARAAALIEGSGYRFVDLPSLEPSEVYTRGTGEDFRNLMYLFTDGSGNEICLRAEWTLAIARYVRDMGEDADQVHRLAYSGPVYRWNQESGGLKEIYQMGIERLGGDDPAGDDVRCVSLAWEIMRGTADNTGIVLNDLQLMREALSIIAPEVFPTDSFPTEYLLSGRLEAELESQPRPAPQIQGPSRFRELLGSVGKSGSEALLAAFIENQFGPPRGIRSSSEIAEDFLRHHSEEPSSLPLSDSQKRDLKRYLAIDAPLEEALAQLEDLLGATTKIPAIDGLRALVTELTEEGIPSDALALNLSLRRGIRYYTGLIFEMRHPSMQRLFGGGRYDNLMKTLGGKPTSAVGFSFNVERLAGLA